MYKYLAVGKPESERLAVAFEHLFKSNATHTDINLALNTLSSLYQKSLSKRELAIKMAKKIKGKSKEGRPHCVLKYLHKPSTHRAALEFFGHITRHCNPFHPKHENVYVDKCVGFVDTYVQKYLTKKITSTQARAALLANKEKLETNAADALLCIFNLLKQSPITMAKVRSNAVLRRTMQTIKDSKHKRKERSNEGCIYSATVCLAAITFFEVEKNKDLFDPNAQTDTRKRFNFHINSLS